MRQFFLVKTRRSNNRSEQTNCKTKDLKNGGCYKKVKVSCEAVSSVRLTVLVFDLQKNLIQMMQIFFQIFDLILRNFISFFRDLNRGSGRKEHLQILVLKSKGKMMERWKCTPFNATKTGIHHRLFHWSSPQISKQLF